MSLVALGVLCDSAALRQQKSRKLAYPADSAFEERPSRGKVTENFARPSLAALPQRLR